MARKKKAAENISEYNNGLSTEKSFKIIVAAKNEEQKVLIRTIGQKVITFIDGPAGSGKTFIAVALGLQALYRGDVKQLVFTRPVLEAGESLGFLPGDVSEKIEPYMAPIFNSLLQLINRKEMNRLLGQGHENKDQDPLIKIVPFAYMRGLAQPLYSKIATPNGWTTMGDVKIGDAVIGSDGSPTKVLETFEHHNKKIYRVKFSDGSYTDCCDDHLWLTKTLSEKRHNKPYSVKTTKEILKNVKTVFGQKNHEIPILSLPVEYQKQKVKLDPYVLGLLLGDGSLHETATIKFTTADTELLDYIRNRTNNEIEIKYCGQYDYRLSKSLQVTQKSNPLKDLVKELNLIGTTSHTKFIPDIYKYNDAEIRLDILRGLMDTDGTIFKHRSGKRRIQYYSVSSQLARDVQEIVQSLGGICHLRKRKKKKQTQLKINNKYKWVCTAEDSYIWVADIIIDGPNIFRLKRKADIFAETKSCRVNRLISEITFIEEMDCRCIVVDKPDHLYLTDNFIVTHNTFLRSFCVIDEAQNTTPSQMRMVLTRIGENSKMVICGDLEQSDLRAKNGLDEVMEVLRPIDDIGFVRMTEESIVRHPLIKKIEGEYRRYYGTRNSYQENRVISRGVSYYDPASGE